MATTTRGRIYARFMEVCPAFQPPHGWEFLRSDPALKRCPPGSADVVSRLVEEFGARSVQQAGVIAGLAGEAPVPNPGLTVQGETLLMLRDAAGEPLNIMTPNGCLTGVVPLWQVWRDAHTQRAASGARSHLFGVTSMGDVALLRCLGLGVSPIAYLDRLQVAGLRGLAALGRGQPLGTPAGHGCT